MLSQYIFIYIYIPPGVFHHSPRTTFLRQFVSLLLNRDIKSEHFYKKMVSDNIYFQLYTVFVRILICSLQYRSSTEYRVQITEYKEQKTANREQSTENRVQRTKYREKSTENRVPIIEYREKSTESRVKKIEYREQSTENRVQRTQYRVQITQQSRVLSTEYTE